MSITTENKTNKGRILVVDDSSSNLQLLSDMLTKRNYQVHCVDNGLEAIKFARSGWAELILLDIQMPKINGYQVCRQLKKIEATRDIPVIFISALDNLLDKKMAFDVGGVDYISKPFQIKEIFMRIENQLTIHAAKAEIHQLNLELEQRVQERTAELEQANQKLMYMALYDQITGLANRYAFGQEIANVLAKAKAEPKYSFAVLFLDCDRFKLINDSFGHLFGDRLLIEVAHRLQNCLNSSSFLSNFSFLARFGGDEFAILLQDCDHTLAIETAQKIQDKFAIPFKIEQYEFFFTVSIGIVLGSKNYTMAEHVLRDADTAMYIAKDKGRACYWLFDSSTNSQAFSRLKLETDLRIALEQEQLIVCYQPIVSLKDDSLTGFEALVRWNHPEKGLISPVDFIPIAEETGLIVPLGFLVMHQACQQLRYWQQRYGVNGLKMSVNLSVKQFSQLNLIEQIEQILTETGLDSQNLKLEITESAIMDNTESAKELLEQLKKRQIQLSIDDFGTGYSSLSYLHRFPVDTLKIDRSFVSRVGAKGENLEIIQAIVTLGHQIGMDVVAEGIETEQQKQYLKVLNCQKGQGYLFSKPLFPKAVESMLAGVYS